MKKISTIFLIIITKTPPTKWKLTINLNQEQFKKIYANLLLIECRNSKQYKVATTNNRVEYIILFNVKNKGGFNIIICKDFILVTSLKNGSFKHEINEDDFIELENLLNSID